MFNQLPLWSILGAMRVCLHGLWKDDASARARIVDETHVCALFLGTRILPLVHLDRQSFFVFIVVVHAADPRHILRLKNAVRLLILQTGDTANQHVFFRARGATDGECDRIISALELVTNMMQRCQAWSCGARLQ